MRKLDQANDSERRAEANRTFHATIYRAARLPRLFATIDDLRAASSTYMRLFGVFHPGFAEASREHAEVLAACEARDPKGAAALMVAHLEHTASVVAAGLADGFDPIHKEE
jgi:DNA-binding GntR family transcriptional regulator